MLPSPQDWTAAGSFGALVSALFAAIYTYLTYRLVRSQNEPAVIVYVRHDESRSTLLQIVIANIGRGLAANVQFTSSRPIPSRAFGLSVNEAEPVHHMEDGPLIKGIRSLGPGDTRKIAWGQFGSLTKALGGEAIELTCTYMHGNRRMPTATFYLDAQSFVSTDAVDSEGARIGRELGHVVAELKGLRRDLARLLPPPAQQQ